MKHFDMLTIDISRLQIHTCLGVLPLEKRVAQNFEVSARLTLPYDGSDSIDSTVNYARVCDIITAEMQAGGDLIEHAALRVARAIMGSFARVSECTVTVTKLNPPMPHATAGVSATITITGKHL